MAGNFVCSEPGIVQAAEQARIRSALFWSEAPLPGDWFAPCPITVRPASHSGCGQTTFQFDRGQVSGWSMDVAGTPEGVLHNVIPHEVDHMVRASLVRHPIERWLDEGCALLMESAEMHAHLRQTAAGISPSIITVMWLEGQEYPQSTQERSDLYAGGFSLVEFLLTRGSPSRLLEFQRDTSPMPVRLRQHYHLSVETLRREWAFWRDTRNGTECREAGCRGHAVPGENPASGSDPRPRLMLWTASWCGPCQQFKQDYATLPEFRQALDASFRLQWFDIDLLAEQAAAVPVTTIPLWILPDRQWTGYSGPDDLLNRLKLTRVSPSMVPTAPEAVPSVVPPSEQKPPSRTTPAPRVPTARPAPATPGWRILRWVPVTLSAMQWLGIIGGSVATGGVGGFALTAAMFLFRWRNSRSSGKRASGSGSSPERSAAAVTAPFPRQLDEAGELLELRQTEGRVATLDTLRGMFLDDELDKLEQSDSVAAQLAVSLRKAIDARVEEVAPLTTEVA